MSKSIQNTKYKVQYDRRNTLILLSEHVDTVRSRGYTPLHLCNDIYSYILHQRNLYRTL